MERQFDDTQKAKYELRTIGGIFGRSDHDRFLRSEVDHQFDEIFPTTVSGKTRALFETGVDALANILVESARPHDAIRLWTAENFCRESLDRLNVKLDGRLEILKYRGPEELRHVADDDFVLYLHFNRYDPSSRSVIETIKRTSKAIVIEDFVQSPLDIARFAGDFAFNSLRKFSSLDVAVAYQNNPQPSSNEESRYRTLRKEAELVRSLFLNNPSEELEQRFLNLGRESEAALSVRGISWAHPSEIERAVAFDFRTAQQLRRINYSRLSSQLSDLIPAIKILAGDYMYLMIENSHRDQYRAELFYQRIFPVIHWADSESEASKSILSLHIDQRYSQVDMDRVARVMADTWGRLLACHSH